MAISPGSQYPRRERRVLPSTPVSVTSGRLPVDPEGRLLHVPDGEAAICWQNGSRRYIKC
jgi:hypothetical protein